MDSVSGLQFFCEYSLLGFYLGGINVVDWRRGRFVVIVFVSEEFVGSRCPRTRTEYTLYIVGKDDFAGYKRLC